MNALEPKLTHIFVLIGQELAEPLAAQPDVGFIVPNIELTPLCSPKFRPGAPSEQAQVCGRLLAEIVENAGCVDLQQLCIVREKLVWTLYCDIVCLDHDGCVVDAAIVALVAALKCCECDGCRINCVDDYFVYMPFPFPVQCNCRRSSTTTTRTSTK